MKEKNKTYLIAGKNYQQQPLVLGQISLLLALLQQLPREASSLSFLTAVGGKLPEVLAVILIPEDTSPREVDYDALKDDMAECPVEVALEIIQDFFSSSQISLISTRLLELVTPFLNRIPSGQLSKLSIFSPEGISSKGSPSDGK